MSDIQQRMDNLRSKLGSAGEKAKDPSLEYFYKVKRENKNNRGKKVYRFDFEDELYAEEGLVIVPIGDVHLGSYQACQEQFEAFVQYILDTPNCVTILNGDLAETATKVSVGKAMFEEEFNYKEQMDRLYAILKPLAEADKILGMGPGNHEERIANLIGINPMETLAEKLDVPYFGYQGFFTLNVGSVRYHVAAFHGTGGGATAGARTNTSQRQNKVVANADVYISGHTHALQDVPDLIYVFDEDAGELKPIERRYVVNGSFLGYWDGYAEMKALAPSISGATRIYFSPDYKEVRVQT